MRSPRTVKRFFDLILEIVEYIASRDDLVYAREFEFEPDALARWIFSDAESVGIAAVNSMLRGLSDRDLERLETIVLSLERQHGRVLETPPSYRLLVDGAILGQVGFIYNRKYREVLAAITLAAAGSRQISEIPDPTGS